MAVIKCEFSSTQQFATAVKTSISNAYKTIAKINRILSKFQCEINWRVPGNLDGNEIGIRYFTYYFYSTFFKSIKANPFSEKMPEELLDTTTIKEKLGVSRKLSPAQEFRLRLAYGITMYRLTVRKKTIEMPEEFYTSIEFYHQGFSLPLPETKLGAETVIKESKFFTFAVSSLIFNLNDYQERCTVTNDYRNSNLEIARLTEAFLHDFSHNFKFEFSQQSYVESFYIILPLMIYYKFINFDFTEYYVNASPFHCHNSFSLNQSLTDQFCHFLEAFFKKHRLQVSSGLLTQNVQVLFFLMTMNAEPTPLKLNIQYSLNIYIGRFIEKRVLDMFSAKSILIVPEQANADVVITDSCFETCSNENTFYVDDVFDSQTWVDLNHFLTEKVQNNLPWLFFRGHDNST